MRYAIEPGLDIYRGEALATLRDFKDACVDMCVTSPPYWGLRDYGIPGTVWGGDANCKHTWNMKRVATEVGRGNWAQGVNGRGEVQPGGVDAKREPIRSSSKRGHCKKCGAWKGCLGLEPDPEMFIKHCVEVFREVRRVLKDEGTLWLNIGDSYASGGRKVYDVNHRPRKARRRGKLSGGTETVDMSSVPRPANPDGLKAKDLIGIPWMLAFALRADGWYLRSDIIWAKPNGMPESVTDRPTRAHEYLFLLAKSPNYYYNSEAIRTPPKAGTILRLSQPGLDDQAGRTRANSGRKTNGPMKAKLTKKDAKSTLLGNAHGRHFLGEAIPEAERRDKQRGHSRKHDGFNERWDQMTREEQIISGAQLRDVWWITPAQFSEAHFATFPEDLIRPCILAGAPVGGVVLDPFLGSGTTALVARKLGCKTIGIELNEEYIQIALRRLSQSVLGFA